MICYVTVYPDLSPALSCLPPLLLTRGRMEMRTDAPSPPGAPPPLAAPGPLLWKRVGTQSWISSVLSWKGGISKEQSLEYFNSQWVYELGFSVDFFRLGPKKTKCPSVPGSLSVCLLCINATGHSFYPISEIKSVLESSQGLEVPSKYMSRS